MKKAICYSLFYHPNTKEYETMCYLRGIYFNSLMRDCIAKDYEIIVFVEYIMYQAFTALFLALATKGVRVVPFQASGILCKDMLERMQAITGYADQFDYYFMRDADALLTQKEVRAMDQFVASGLNIHSIHDNTAHNVPLLGGLCGFNSAWYNGKGFKVEGDFTRKGSDQDWLQRTVFDPSETLLHNFKGLQTPALKVENTVPSNGSYDIGADLCSSFIGAAGFNEMETLRYFESKLGAREIEIALAKKYPNIFWWIL